MPRESALGLEQLHKRFDRPRRPNLRRAKLRDIAEAIRRPRFRLESLGRCKEADKRLDASLVGDRLGVLEAPCCHICQHNNRMSLRLSYQRVLPRSK